MDPRTRLMLAIGLALTVMSGSGCRSALSEREMIRLSETGIHPGQHLIRSTSDRFVAQGLLELANGNPKKASEAFNSALKYDPIDARNHFLNGLAYHLLALSSDSFYYELALEGYGIALRLDPMLERTRFQLGLCHLDRGEFDLARRWFADALLQDDDDPDTLYAFLFASYYSGELIDAAAALEKLARIEPDSPRTLRASAIVFSSIGRADANTALDRLRKIEPEGSLDDLAARANQWNEFVARERARREDAKPSDENRTPRSTGPLENPRQGDLSTERSHEMVKIDVVIMRVEELKTRRRGVNFLDKLAVQFGTLSVSGRPTGKPSEGAYGVVRGADGKTTTQWSVSIPALEYTLNIFNDDDDKAEILAKPTLTAMNGQRASFFSGTHIKAAVTGNQYGSSPLIVEADVGVSLAITPRILDDGRIQVHVEAGRTLLVLPELEKVIYDSVYQLSKTNVETEVVLRSGETLVLSGLAEEERLRTSSGVPGLARIPIVKYLFSERVERTSHQSTVIMLTPRAASYLDAGGELSRRNAHPESALADLRRTRSDWFAPYRELSAMVSQYPPDEVRRLIRKNDLSMQRWESSVHERLRTVKLLERTR